MCRAGRLWVGKITAVVDCSSPLERSDVAEESRAIVGVLRAVEEALRKGTNTRAKGFRRSRASRPKHHRSDIAEKAEATPALALYCGQHETRDRGTRRIRGQRNNSHHINISGHQCMNLDRRRARREYASPPGIQDVMGRTGETVRR